MPGKVDSEVMKDLMKSRGKPPPMDEATGPDEEPPADDGEGSYEQDELAAMQDFDDASDAEGRLTAIKALLEICVPRIMGKG